MKRSVHLSIDGAAVRADIRGGQPGSIAFYRLMDDDTWSPMGQVRGNEMPTGKRLKRMVREHRLGRKVETCTVCGCMKEAPRIMVARECTRCQVEGARALRAAGEVGPVWAKGLGDW